jgi:hypothetical protein
MRRLILALGAGALCLALAPTLALGIQSNDAAAAAAGINTNAIVQGIAQSGGPAGGQAAGQQGTATQVLPIAVAPAVNAQVVPVNANVPVRVASPGDDGPVVQRNSAAAAAAAVNANTVAQRLTQRAGSRHGAKPSAGGQAAGQQGTATQVLPIAVAPAVNAQVVPVNANVPIALGLPPLPIDPFAVLADPVGTVTGVLADPLGAVTGVLGGLPLPIAI